MATNGPPLRGLCACKARATRSLPLPVSPRIRTVASLAAQRVTCSRTARATRLLPEKSVSRGRGVLRFERVGLTAPGGAPRPCNKVPRSIACSNAARTESAEYSRMPAMPACSASSVTRPVPTMTSTPCATSSDTHWRASSAVTKARCAMGRSNARRKSAKVGMSDAWVITPMRSERCRARVRACIRSKPLGRTSTTGNSARAFR